MADLLMPPAGLPAAAQPAQLEVTGQVAQPLSLSRTDLLTARDGYQASFP